MTPYWNFRHRWKSLWHYHQVLILSQNRARWSHIIFTVTHFCIMMVSSTRNVCKQSKWPNERGAFGTGFTSAAVLCFKPAVNRQPGFSRWDSSSYTFSEMVLSDVFLEKSTFSKFPKQILQKASYVSHVCIITRCSYSAKIKFYIQTSF